MFFTVCTGNKANWDVAPSIPNPIPNTRFAPVVGLATTPRAGERGCNVHRLTYRIFEFVFLFRKHYYLLRRTHLETKNDYARQSFVRYIVCKITFCYRSIRPVGFDANREGKFPKRFMKRQRSRLFANRSRRSVSVRETRSSSACGTNRYSPYI